MGKILKGYFPIGLPVLRTPLSPTIGFRGMALRCALNAILKLENGTDGSPRYPIPTT